MAHDGVTLPKTFPIARSAHAYLRFVATNLILRYHPSTHSLDTFRQELTNWEVDLDYYSPQ